MGEMLFSKKASTVAAGVCFLIYSILAALLILQSLIGLLCDVVGQVRSEERDGRAVGLVKQEILASLRMNDDGDGRISEAELHTVMTAKATRAVMRKLQIDPLFLFELLKTLYSGKDRSVP